MHFLFVNGLVPHYSNSIIGVEWYISDLVLFWLIVPILNKGLKKLSRTVLICVLVFIFSFVLESILRPIRWDVDQYIFDQFICYTMPIKQLPYFLIGFAWARMKQESSFFEEHTQKSHDLIISGLSLGVFSFFIYIVISLTEVDTVLFGGYLYLSTAWILAFASLQLYYPNLVICRILSVVGRYSLGIYLFHLPINDAYRQFGEPTGTISWLVQYVFVVLTSYLMSLVIMNGFVKVSGVIKNSIKMGKTSNDKTG